MIKYKKFIPEIDQNLEQIIDSKIRLICPCEDDEQGEGIWVKRLSDGKHVVLMNHAVNLYPVHSWGSVHKIVNGLINDIK